MATLTFSQLVDRSFKATRPLLKTYILGALMIIVVSMMFRGLGGGLFALTDVSGIQDNLILIFTAATLGFLFTLASAFVQALQNMYTIVIAVDRTNGIKASIRKTLQYFWRLFLGSIWIMLRSYTWIGFLSLPFFILGSEGDNPAFILIGILICIVAVVCAVFFLPRLAFINIIQLQDGTGVRKSADVSLERTRGYWGKIVGNNLLMVLCLFLVTLAVFAIPALVAFTLVMMLDSLSTLLIVIVAVPLGLIAIIGAVIYFFGITLFGQVYMVELYETIKANPKSVAS